MIKIGQPVEGQVLDARAGLEPEDGSGRLGGHLDLAVRVDDGHGVGQAVEGLLGGLLDAHHFGLVRPPEHAQAGGHGVERLG